MKCFLATSLFLAGLVLAPTLAAQTNVVNHLTMNQWVRPAEDGLLKGRVVLPRAHGEVEALEGVAVTMMSREGDVWREKSNSKGEFAIADVQSGVYTLTARADHVYSCCAIHVIDPTDTSSDSYPMAAEISVANVDYTIVHTSMIRYLPPKLKANASIADAQLDRLADRVCGSELFRVVRSDGGLKGRLHLAGAVGSDLQSADRTNVFLFQDGAELERTLTDEQGRFAIEQLQPGHYSLLAIGAGGVGLISFELVDLAEHVRADNQVDDEAEQFVGIHRDCCSEFAMQVAPMPGIPAAVVDHVAVVEPPAEIVEGEIMEGGGGPDCGVDCGCGADLCGLDAGCGCGEFLDGELLIDGYGTPLAGGGYLAGYGGGGFYGGAGGGGFGGGLGGIAALAGIGGALAATSDDNNNQPVIASPAVVAN